MATTFNVTGVLPETGCTREDIYQLLRTLDPRAELIDTDVFDVTGNKIRAGVALSYWRKYSKTYADLAAAAGSNDIELFKLPAGGVLEGVKIKHSAAWAGGSLSQVLLSVGVTGSLQKYVKEFAAIGAPSSTGYRLNFPPLWDVNLPPAAVNTDGTIGGLTVGASYVQAQVTALRDACEVLADDYRALRAAVAGLYQGRFGGESHDAETSVRLSAVATGGLLNAATGGAVDVWCKWSVEI